MSLKNEVKTQSNQDDFRTMALDVNPKYFFCIIEKKPYGSN